MRIHPFKIVKGSREEILFQEDRGSKFYGRLHNHPEIQVTLILHGTGTLILDDYMGGYQPGDLFVIGSNLPHVFKSNKNIYSHSYSIFLDKNIFNNPLIDTGEPFVQALKNNFGNGLKIYGITKNSFEKIKNSKGIEMSIHALGLLAQISGSRYDKLTVRSGTAEVNQKEGDRLNDIFEYALENYLYEISLADVSERANLTRSAFCRYFKQRTGKTFYEMIIDLRISKAVELLRNPDLPIFRVSAESGFANLSNFNRKFKSRKGITPSLFRKQLWNEQQ